MASTVSKVIFTVLGLIALAFGIVALVFGPRLYRAGKTLVDPIVAIGQAEKQMTALNQDLPFAPSPENLISEDRLLVFFEIREELEPHYQKWSEAESQIDGKQNPSLQEIGGILAQTEDVLGAQVDILRHHGMSGAEFRWLETRIYSEWLAAFERQGIEDCDPAITRRLNELTEDDLDFLAELRGRHGGSAALQEVQQRLRERLAVLNAPFRPEVPGIPEETGQLLFEHQERIVALKLGQYELHARLRKSGGLQVDIGGKKKVEIDS